jgi:hypothetical protein
VLPADRYIASLLGLTEEQYEFWKDYVEEQAKKGPQPAVVCGEPTTTLAVVSLVLTIIGVGFQIIGFLLQSRPGRPAELQTRNKNGNNQIGISSFAPRAGFDAIQDVAALGSPIPVVYANRETIEGKTYGGVRANLSLLWAQVWSLGGSQMLRAVFMIGEGDVESIDPIGFAIGDNTIGAYDLLSTSANQSGSRITIYYRGDGGRIISSDRIAGRAANQDPGNAQNSGGDDVFSVLSVGNQWAQDFSATSKPSNSTTFGVFRLIGNNLAFKLNPNVRPGVNARLKPVGDEGDARVQCPIDNVANVQRQKFAATFSSRSGITSGSFGEGDTFTYKLLKSSDFETEYSYGIANEEGWESDKELNRGPIVYAKTGATLTIDWLSFLTVEEPDVDTVSQTASVRALFNTTAAQSALSTAAEGRYRIEYWVKLENDEIKEDVSSFFDAIITIYTDQTLYEAEKNDDGLVTDIVVKAGTGGSFMRFEYEVSRDSTPLSAQGGNLRADINFDFSELDAYIEKTDDAASSIAARQKSWDDAIIVGEMYKVGSALAVCSGRAPDSEIFRSDSDLGTEDSGQDITATFRVVRSGSAATVTESSLSAPSTDPRERETATSGPHIFRVAIANVATQRDCRIVEIGLKSALGLSFNGLLRFRTTLSFEEADERACVGREDDIIKRGRILRVDQYQSGTITTPEDRFSFFRIYVRKYGAENFIPLSQCFGIGSQTQQAVFNYFRLEMPSLSRWEIRIEPLTGWEIREGAASGALWLLDARLGQVQSVSTSTGFGQVVVRFNGRSIDRSVASFTLKQSQRANMGLEPIDTNNNHVDAWGKLAEGFVYEQVESSASNGPEHEIVYVNEIVENEEVPEYTGIALVGINVRSSFEWAQFRQFSSYVNKGAKVRRLLNNLSVGASHLFPDVALDRFTNAKYGPGRISDDLIILDDFKAAAQWCQDRKYFFDGPVMLGTNTPRQWAADVAGTMLLDFREIGGRYSLTPAITFEKIKHKALFTAGNIEEGTFKFETVAVDDLRPVRVSAKWREERLNLDLNSPGLFPVEREVVVREASPFGSDSDPLESIDLSDYVTSEEHVIDVCKFRIRSKRLRDHVVKFQITYDSLAGVCADLYPGDYIRVAMDSTFFNQFNNGGVTKDGTIISSRSLAPGSYDVIAWAGDERDPSERVLEVSENGKGNLRGFIFTVKTTNVRSYQISKITPTDEGKFDIEATHSPTNNNGLLLIAEGWNNESNWVISR